MKQGFHCLGFRVSVLEMIALENDAASIAVDAALREMVSTEIFCLKK